MQKAPKQIVEGEKQKALDLLKDMPMYPFTYPIMGMDPLLDPIRDDPEFQKILQSLQDEIMKLRNVVKQAKYADELDRVLSR